MVSILITVQNKSPLQMTSVPFGFLTSVSKARLPYFGSLSTAHFYFAQYSAFSTGIRHILALRRFYPQCNKLKSLTAVYQDQ
jgi:hypothetical protein